ncbi:MAG: hypothetical protein IT357_00430 [Gemmatimonadaceae bacterium]|nr:hypothetical protein [Gemmatimonadaceae bacterium]
MTRISWKAARYVFLAALGFVLGSVVRTAEASPRLVESNYAVSSDGYDTVCSGDPGTDCDEPDR